MKSRPVSIAFGKIVLYARKNKGDHEQFDYFPLSEAKVRVSVCCEMGGGWTAIYDPDNTWKRHGLAVATAWAYSPEGAAKFLMKTLNKRLAQLQRIL